MLNFHKNIHIFEMGRELASPFCDLKRTSSFVADDLQVDKENQTQKTAFAKGLRRSKSERNLKVKDPGQCQST